MLGDNLEFQSESNWRGSSGLRVPFYRRTWFSALAAFVILAAVAAFATFSIVVAPLREKAEALDLNELKKLEVASVIYDRNGGELARLYMFNRTPVKISEVPKHLIDALTSQEDSRFFQHKGVDYVGLIRAVWLNFRAGEVTQGASTITQQLGRQTFGLLERSYKRKILEAFLAQRIEQQYSKSEILELYLNRIFFGHNFYGIQAAAQGYFGKDVKDLSIEESATLCGIIKGPNPRSPLKHPERAIKERNYVLERMVEENHLTREEAAKLASKPLITVPQSGDPRLSYVFEEVRQAVVKMVGEERAAIGGFQIYTTIDPALQKASEESVNKRLAEVEKRPGYEHQTYAQFRTLMSAWKSRLASGQINPATPRPRPEYLQGAALVIDNRDGGILALVGGRDFIDSQYDRAFASLRPAGTAFIPFVYAAAFSRPEFFPGTQLEDAPIDNRRVMIGGLTGILGEWGSEEEQTKFMSSISARESLVHSRNSATVRLGEKVGLQEVKELAARAGIGSTLRDYPSTYLGASEVKLDEMCLAYSVFPNQGRRPKDLHLISRVTDANDNVVFQVAEDEDTSVEAIDPIAAYQTHSCLVDALHRGTGSPAMAEFGLRKFPCAGKTGTHYEFKDLWFFGYTSSVTCGVWVGFDKQKPIYTGAFSNRIALPIGVDILNGSEKDHATDSFEPPANAERVELCAKSGMRATDFCYEKVQMPDGSTRSQRCTYFEYLRPGSTFDSYCTLHTGEGLPADIAAFHLTSNDPMGGLTADSSKFAHIDPVRMQGLTVLGSDPYKSIAAIPRAVPVNEDGTAVRRAQPVDTAPDETIEVPIKLAPPPPMKIEL